MAYNHNEIEKKWQDEWEKQELYKTPENPDPDKKKYILDMFPYPSGAGLHVGHPIGYIGTDIFSRFSRMSGFGVLHPMGWDAFGLPAENYAIKTGIRPEETTRSSIERFRQQMKMIGLSYDWSREINTSDPSYYKWTQWLFLLFYKNGLAYKKEAYVNWCPKDNTVLANEQVVNGACERCGTIVVQKLLSQWFFKITDFADELLDSLETLDWPEPIKHMQRNWIGKSMGALIDFNLKFSSYADNNWVGEDGKNAHVTVFTTRPDTIYGATYLVLAPEHPWVLAALEHKHVLENNDEVLNYVNETKQKTELQRVVDEKNKTGVELKGVKAVNPATNSEIPIWIADYVLANYGTGAIMAVPAHDERDHEFAKKFDLGIVKVVKPDHEIDDVYTEEGLLINSGEFSGQSSGTARATMAEKFGTPKVQYKLRDWLVSRQRYWGAPIPMIYCDKCGMQPVPESDLPVLLPTDVDFLPTGESPLARSQSFHQVKCPNCGGDAKRDSDTMDTFVDSSWYFFRFTDPHNDLEFASKEKMQAWLPVDTYVGGAEHAVLHLLYARFFTKVLNKLGYITFTEPFLQLKNQGLVLGLDGEKMSKSRGNVINPDDVVAQQGADALRMYEMFMSPFHEVKPWSTQGIVGIERFLEKVYKLKPGGEDSRDIHKLIRKITSDIQAFKFNTAIAAFMEYLNEHKQLSSQDHEILLKLLAPFAPYLTEELWHNLGHADSVHVQPWPQYDESLAKDDKVTIVVQFNGKKKMTLEVEQGMSEEEVKAKVDLSGKEVQKVIFVPDKLINFVISKE